MIILAQPGYELAKRENSINEGIVFINKLLNKTFSKFNYITKYMYINEI